jgi:hypothetical protein
MSLVIVSYWGVTMTFHGGLLVKKMVFQTFIIVCDIVDYSPWWK